MRGAALPTVSSFGRNERRITLTTDIPQLLFRECRGPPSAFSACGRMGSSTAAELRSRRQRGAPWKPVAVAGGRGLTNIVTT